MDTIAVTTGRHHPLGHGLPVDTVVGESRHVAEEVGISDDVVTAQSTATDLAFATEFVFGRSLGIGHGHQVTPRVVPHVRRLTDVIHRRLPPVQAVIEVRRTELLGIVGKNFRNGGFQRFDDIAVVVIGAFRRVACELSRIESDRRDDAQFVCILDIAGGQSTVGRPDGSIRPVIFRAVVDQIVFHAERDARVAVVFREVCDTADESGFQADRVGNRSLIKQVIQQRLAEQFVHGVAIDQPRVADGVDTRRLEQQFLHGDLPIEFVVNEFGRRQRDVFRRTDLIVQRGTVANAARDIAGGVVIDPGDIAHSVRRQHASVEAVVGKGCRVAEGRRVGG